MSSDTTGEIYLVVKDSPLPKNQTSAVAHPSQAGTQSAVHAGVSAILGALVLAGFVAFR